MIEFKIVYAKDKTPVHCDIYEGKLYIGRIWQNPGNKTWELVEWVGNNFSPTGYEGYKTMQVCISKLRPVLKELYKFREEARKDN